MDFRNNGTYEQRVDDIHNFDDENDLDENGNGRRMIRLEDDKKRKGLSGSADVDHTREENIASILRQRRHGRKMGGVFGNDRYRQDSSQQRFRQTNCECLLYL